MSLCASIRQVRNTLVIGHGLGLALYALLVISLISSTSLNAFGDGLFQEQLSGSFGDRKADLIIKMNPPIVTTETLKNQNHTHT